MTEDAEKRLLLLTGRLCDEQITEEEFAELDQILRADAEAREAYRVYLEMHEHLVTGALESESEEAASKTIFPFPITRSAIGLAAAALVTAGFFLHVWVAPQEQVAEPTPDFVLTRAIDVEWEHKTRFRAIVGEPITEPALRINSGIAQVQFASGATVTVEGPAKLRLDDPMKCFHHHGKLTAYCPESAHGFMIRFPGGRVIDLGTEFALNSEQGGKTDVHVLDGEVIVARTDEEDKVLRRQNLKGHSAVSVGEEQGIEEIAYDDAPFSNLTRDRLSRTQPIKLQFDLGHRAGLYRGTDAPAHVVGDMVSHEAHWTQIVGDQSGSFVMADGTYCPHPIEVDYGHGSGVIDWDAEPVDPWGKVHNQAKGVFATSLAQDHRPWDKDLGFRVRGLPPGTYRVYALCRSARRPGAFYEVSFGVNLDRQLAHPIEMPPMDPDVIPEWSEGVTYEVEDVEVSSPDDWVTFITRYSRERSVKATPHHGRSVLLGMQIVQIP